MSSGFPSYIIPDPSESRFFAPVLTPVTHLQTGTGNGLILSNDLTIRKTGPAVSQGIKYILLQIQAYVRCELTS